MFESVIKVPYVTGPSMEKYEGPLVSKTLSKTKILQKIREIKELGKKLYFQSSICRDERLVQKTSNKLGLPGCETILELGLMMDEEIAIIHRGRLEALFFAFPSSWNPGNKEGATLLELHGPVAEGERLREASDGLSKAICGKYSFRRFVWSIAPTGRLSRHPDYSDPIPQSIDDLWLRVETQYTTPIVYNETAAFIIDLQVIKLTDVFKEENDKKLIIESINSMSAKVLEYKNLNKIKNIINDTEGAVL